LPRAGTLNISIFVSFSEMLKLSVPSAFSKLEYFSVAKIIVNENSSAKGGRRKLFGGFSSEVKKIRRIRLTATTQGLVPMYSHNANHVAFQRVLTWGHSDL